MAITKLFSRQTTKPHRQLIQFNTTAFTSLDQPAEEAVVTEHELQLFRYKSDPAEWPAEEFDSFRNRVVPLFEKAIEHSIASEFAVPVDFSLNPAYPQRIAYPVDLTLIKERLTNGFYRLVLSLFLLPGGVNASG